MRRDSCVRKRAKHAAAAIKNAGMSGAWNQRRRSPWLTPHTKSPSPVAREDLRGRCGEAAATESDLSTAQQNQSRMTRARGLGLPKGLPSTRNVVRSKRRCKLRAEDPSSSTRHKFQLPADAMSDRIREVG